MGFVEEASTFDELELGFKNKLEDLKLLSNLQSGWGSHTVLDVNECKEALDSIASDVRLYKKHLEDARQWVETVKEQYSRIQSLSDRLTYMKNNIPEHVPCSQTEQKNAEKLSKTTETSKSNNNPKAINGNAHKETVKINGGSSSTSISKIKYISLEEYETVPKYIKGRIPYHKVNETIEIFNACLGKKYDLMRKPRNKLSPMELAAVSEYKNQITAETKKTHFFVESDLKRHTTLKVDATVRSILTIIRSLRRVKEVRGPASLVRYCVVN